MILVLAIIGTVAVIIMLCLSVFWLYDGVKKANQLELSLIKSGLIRNLTPHIGITPVHLLDTEEISSLVIRLEALEEIVERIENEKANRNS